MRVETIEAARLSGVGVDNLYLLDEAGRGHFQPV